MYKVFLILMAMTTPIAAQEWQKLDDAGIMDALSDRTLIYDNASQEFHKDGRTLYQAAAPSWGGWRASGGQYCSVWPPSSVWTCYDLEREVDGLRVRFTSSDGSNTIGTYRKR